MKEMFRAPAAAYVMSIIMTKHSLGLAS